MMVVRCEIFWLIVSHSRGVMVVVGCCGSLLDFMG